MTQVVCSTREVIKHISQSAAKSKADWSHKRNKPELCVVLGADGARKVIQPRAAKRNRFETRDRM